MDETLALLLLIVPTATCDGEDVHDLLKDHGLPVGLCPNSAISYSFGPSTSLLEAHLDYPYYAKYDFMVYFDRVVTGNLSYGELSRVVGLKQEELFVWLPVKGIIVNKPSLNGIIIDIDIARKHLSLSLLEVSSECMPSGGAKAGDNLKKGFELN